MDPFTLHVLTGHTDMNTTKRYIHPDEARIREARFGVVIVLGIVAKTATRRSLLILLQLKD
jgi:hypothetical protein